MANPRNQRRNRNRKAQVNATQALVTAAQALTVTAQALTTTTQQLVNNQPQPQPAPVVPAPPQAVNGNNAPWAVAAGAVVVAAILGLALLLNNGKSAQASPAPAPTQAEIHRQNVVAVQKIAPTLTDQEIRLVRNSRIDGSIEEWLENNPGPTSLAFNPKNTTTRFKVAERNIIVLVQTEFGPRTYRYNEEGSFENDVPGNLKVYRLNVN